ncbi:hypothetical protein [Streptomyces sp. NPDC002520]
MTTTPSALVDLFALFTDFDSDAPEPEFVCSTRAWIAETYRTEDGHLHVRLICEHGKDTHWPHTRLTQVPVDSVYDTDRRAATRVVWAQGYKARNGTLWHAEVKDGGRVLRLLLVPMSEEERAAGRPEGVPADAPAPAAAAPVERVRYFDAPSTMRLGDRWAFVSLGRAYEVRRAGRGQWVVTPWEGGPSVAEGSSKAAAVAAAHEATGGVWDVAEPRVREREGRRARAAGQDAGHHLRAGGAVPPVGGAARRRVLGRALLQVQRVGSHLRLRAHRRRPVLGTV